MNLFRKAAGFLALGWTLFAGSLSAEQPGPANAWITHWLDYGYGSGAYEFDLSPRMAPLERFEEELLEIHRTMRDHLQRHGSLDLNPIVVPIGRWGPYEVFDVIEESHLIKQILLRFPTGEYRVLASLQVGELTGSPIIPRSFLLESEGRTILGSEIWIYRHARSDHYFVLGKGDDSPVLLDLSVIGDGLARFVPDWGTEDLYAYPRFQIRDLSCEVRLERYSPGGSRQHGGNVTLQFRLEDDQLKIVDGSFDPDFASGFDPNLKDLGLLDARQVRRSELSRNYRELIERNPGYRFFAFGDFSGEGKSEFALIGTYQTGAALSRERRRSPYRERIGGRGTFLLIRQVGRSVTPNERPADFLVTFDEEFAVLDVSGDQLRVFFCLDCSDGARIRWSGRNFELAPFEN